MAGSVAEARTLFDEQRHDLLIGDIELPDGSGIELMRELAGRCHLKGIAVTGHGGQEDVAKTTAAGFDAHLVKPVSIDTLVNTIKKVLGD
jgi:two-component system CheB/CheR fusion protein